MWSEQEAVSPSYLGGRSEEVRLADRSTPTQTVNEHGTHRVTIIIETLACIINIISGVSYPGLGSSIYDVSYVRLGPGKAFAQYFGHWGLQHMQHMQ